MVTIYYHKLFMLVKPTGVYQKLNSLLGGMSSLYAATQWQAQQ